MMHNRSGENVVRAALGGKQVKKKEGGCNPRQSKLPLSVGIVRTMQDNTQIYASTIRSHPSDAPALIPNTISPPNTYMMSSFPPPHPPPHPTSRPSTQPSVEERGPQEDVLLLRNKLASRNRIPSECICVANQRGRHYHITVRFKLSGASEVCRMQD